jgi:hypothetical protein
MNFRIDMKIIALEPQPGGLTLIEGLATDGTSAVVTVRVAEPLAVGGWMTMALLAEPAAAQPAAAASMRERMQVRASGLATASAAQTPRSATDGRCSARAGRRRGRCLVAAALLDPGESRRHRQKFRTLRQLAAGGAERGRRNGRALRGAAEKGLNRWLTKMK